MLERAGLTEFADPEPILKALDAALFLQYQETNTAADSNTHLTIRADGTFHIKTPALDTSETDPLQELFPQRHDVPLAQVLDTVNRHCNCQKLVEHPAQQTHINCFPTCITSGNYGFDCGIRVRRWREFLPE